MTTKEKKELTKSLLNFLSRRASSERHFYEELVRKEFDNTAKWACLEHRAHIIDAIHFLNT